MGIKCWDYILDISVLEFVGILSMFLLFNESYLCWFGYVRWMDVEWILKDILFGEFVIGFRCILRFIKWGIDLVIWEVLVIDRSKWRIVVKIVLGMKRSRGKSSGRKREKVLL